MLLHKSTPREDYISALEGIGMYYHTTPSASGPVPYWTEDHFYEISPSEVEAIEVATETLHQQCVQTVRAVIDAGPEYLRNYELPPTAHKAIELSFNNDPTLCGRFDFAFDSQNIKLLEYNADTPTGILEASIAQWDWLEAVYPQYDQFNSLHERLVKRIGELASKLNLQTFHVSAVANGDKVEEEWSTAEYIKECAQLAGLQTFEVELADVMYDTQSRRFFDPEGNTISALYKLYPWENMMYEPFFEVIRTQATSISFFEPPWKAIISNKAFLVDLYKTFPDSPYVLPASFNPADLPQASSWVSKPLWGREGDGVSVRTPLAIFDNPQGATGSGPKVYQEYVKLPDLGYGNVVLGSWVVGQSSAGVCFRESDSLVTDYYARCAPHLINAPAPTEDLRQLWLTE